MKNNASDDVLEPRANASLFGHEATEAMLYSDIKQSRLHHAYMFCGPKGIGKATLAYRFARYLLKHDAVSARELEPVVEMGLFAGLDMPLEKTAIAEDAPPEKSHDVSAFYMDVADPIFKRVAGGSHTDLLTLSPLFDAKKQQEKAEISVDQARKVSEFLALTPAESSWRVVIIDAVDQLNTQSANALLKILEEPPSNSIILLVCHNPALALATIRSRCRKVNMSACKIDAFSEVLSRAASHIPETMYHSLYGLSEGCPGQAVQFYAQHAIETYAAILHALKPSSSLNDRRKFAEGAALMKSPLAWQIVVDMWKRLTERVWLCSQRDCVSIVENEPQILAELRQHYTIESWLTYRERVLNLLMQTQVFNLEKRHTALLMVSPRQMLSAQAA